MASVYFHRTIPSLVCPVRPLRLSIQYIKKMKLEQSPLMDKLMAYAMLAHHSPESLREGVLILERVHPQISQKYHNEGASVGGCCASA